MKAWQHLDIITKPGNKRSVYEGKHHIYRTTRIIAGQQRESINIIEAVKSEQVSIALDYTIPKILVKEKPHKEKKVV
jgi:hypothetical protein